MSGQLAAHGRRPWRRLCEGAATGARGAGERGRRGERGGRREARDRERGENLRSRTKDRSKSDRALNEQGNAHKTRARRGLQSPRAAPTHAGLKTEKNRFLQKFVQNFLGAARFYVFVDGRDVHQGRGVHAPRDRGRACERAALPSEKQPRGLVRELLTSLHSTMRCLRPRRNFAT